MEDKVEFLRQLLESRKVDYEVYISESRGVTVETRDLSVDALKVRSSAGVGLRVFKDKRPGFAYSSVFSDEALGDMVEAALSGSTKASADEFIAFAPKCKVPEVELSIYDAAVERSTEDEKIEKALAIEKSTRGFDKRIKTVRKASYSESLASSRTINSNGVDARYKASFCSGSVMAVAEQGGESQMGFEVALDHQKGGVAPESIGRGAGERAVSLLGARQAETMRCPAVFDNMVAVEFVGALVPSFLGDNVEKGKSMLKGRLGEKVVSENIRINDDGLMPGGWSSSQTDCEGVPRQKTELVKDGILGGFLFDTYWGAREGGGSTGSAVRGGYKSTPGVGVSNLYIEKGEEDLDGLLSLMGTGLLITEVMGVHTIDGVSGDFSLGAAGFKVENGRVTYPLRGLAISGNILNLFSAVSSVGSDIRFLGSIGSPSLLFEAIEASGS